MAEIFWHNLSIEEITKLLKTNLEEGLSEDEVKKRQKEFGKNLLPEEKPFSKLKIFLGQFKSPLIYILLIAGNYYFDFGRIYRRHCYFRRCFFKCNCWIYSRK